MQTCQVEYNAVLIRALQEVCNMVDIELIRELNGKIVISDLCNMVDIELIRQLNGKIVMSDFNY